MPSPESAPAYSQPEIIEKKSKKERFITIPTHIRGVSLRFEPDVEPAIVKKTIEGLYSLARDHAARKFQIDELASQQDGSGKEIKALAKTHEGLRGIQSQEDNFVLTVMPKDRVLWNHQLLKESLGVAYPGVVHQDLIMTITVPAGLQTEKGAISEELLKQVLTQALLGLGLSEDDLKKIMEAKVDQRVDVKTLEDMIESGKVRLLAGTKQTQRTWAITVGPFEKTPKN